VNQSRILLVGMMGVGKTTVGGIVARRLGWCYLDSDAEIIRTTGKSVPEIFALQGEPAFRAEEARVLAEAVTSEFPVVISVAGGAVLDPANRARIAKSGIVVWLRARPETLGTRVGDGAGRPLLGDDPTAAMRRLLDERAPLYAELAELVIDVDDLPPTQVAERILAATAGEQPGEGPGGAA